MKSEMKKGIKMISGIPDPCQQGTHVKQHPILKPYKKTYEKVKKRKKKKGKEMAKASLSSVAVYPSRDT